MRKHLISAHVQVSFSYVLGEISRETYVKITVALAEEMTDSEIAEAITQANEAIRGLE